MNTATKVRMCWFRDNYIPESEGLIKILDVGSMDVNGSCYDLFRDHLYDGLDITEGKNVHLVPKNIYKWDEIGDDIFDVVISANTFEHCEYFWQTMSEIVRVLKQGGLICLIIPCGYYEHRYPVDCYRFHTDGMVALARYCNLQILHASTNAAPHRDDYEWFSREFALSMLVATKPYSGKTQLINFSKPYKLRVTEPSAYNNFFTYEERKRTLRDWIASGFKELERLIRKQ